MRFFPHASSWFRIRRMNQIPSVFWVRVRDYTKTTLGCGIGCIGLIFAHYWNRALNEASGMGFLLLSVCVCVFWLNSEKKLAEHWLDWFCLQSSTILWKDCYYSWTTKIPQGLFSFHLWVFDLGKPLKSKKCFHWSDEHVSLLASQAAWVSMVKSPNPPTHSLYLYSWAIKETPGCLCLGNYTELVTSPIMESIMAPNSLIEMSSLSNHCICSYI